MEETLQRFLDVRILDLQHRQRLLDPTQTFRVIRLIHRSTRVLFIAVMLDLLTTVLDLGEAERCR